MPRACGIAIRPTTITPRFSFCLTIIVRMWSTWLYWNGSTGWGTFLLVVTVIVATLDNVLRPILIKKGADLPLLLIFVGVIGGLVAFGLIGIFIGPVVLAVAHTLVNAWMDRELPAATNPGA